MNSEACPKCGEKLNILQSSGRQICPSCKWNNQSGNSNFEVEEKKNSSYGLIEQNAITEKLNFVDGLFSDHSNKLTGKIFFLLGLVVMLFGLGYDTTVCNGTSEFSSSCLSRTHNIGLLNTRSNIVNIGGFICVSGCILLTKSKKY
jgi:hypothetical protein